MCICMNVYVTIFMLLENMYGSKRPWLQVGVVGPIHHGRWHNAHWLCCVQCGLGIKTYLYTCVDGCLLCFTLSVLLDNMHRSKRPRLQVGVGPMHIWKRYIYSDHFGFMVFGQYIVGTDTHIYIYIHTCTHIMCIYIHTFMCVCMNSLFHCTHVS